MSDLYVSPQHFQDYMIPRLDRPARQHESYTRQELIEELQKIGAHTDELQQLPIPSLVTMYTIFGRYLASIQVKRRPGRPKGSSSSKRISSTDKKILKSLLSHQGNVSSLVLSKELDIPLSTVQRRRKRLEQHLLDKSYTLKADRFGLRTAELFVSTKNGMIASVAKELISTYTGVESVSRIIGTGLSDLRARIVFRHNSELLNLVERIKSLNYVEDIFWIEIMENIGKNNVSKSIL